MLLTSYCHLIKVCAVEINASLLEEHFEDPFHRGPGEASTHAWEAESDEGHLQLRIEFQLNPSTKDHGAPTIADGWFDARGGLICESLPSILLERLIDQPVLALHELQSDQLASKLQLSDRDQIAQVDFVLSTMKAALQHPLSSMEEDLADGRQFGGPSLREEC